MAVWLWWNICVAHDAVWQQENAEKTPFENSLEELKLQKEISGLEVKKTKEALRRNRRNWK